MNLIRLFLMVSLLAISGPSSALFMPEGFKVDNGEPVESSDSSDSGC